VIDLSRATVEELEPGGEAIYRGHEYRSPVAVSVLVG